MKLGLSPKSKVTRLKHGELVRDIPIMHKRASNTNHYSNTPQEALEIIGLCDVHLKEFRAHSDVAMKTPL